jgi:predicted secreted protein
MPKLLLVLIVFISGFAAASHHQVIDTLGRSPKGQYVALEEYGYKQDKHSYYVTIKIMNVWIKEYVGAPIQVEIPAHNPQFLNKAREKAKMLAQEELKRFQISG